MPLPSFRPARAERVFCHRFEREEQREDGDGGAEDGRLRTDGILPCECDCESVPGGVRRWIQDQSS